MKIYQAMRAVMSDIGALGITKSRKNQQQGYSFRGIDEVYNEMNPLFAKHGVLMLPRVISSEQTDRMNKSGGLLIYTRLHIEFDFIATEDGSKHTVATVGEAMDSADKSSNKAMAAAYKYAAMMAFCIPTEGDNDADATTHQVVPKAAPAPVKAPLPKVLIAPSADSPALATITAALKLCATPEALDDWCNADTNKVAFNALSDADYDTLNSRIIRWREHVAKVAA
jgi:hypothetical protein